jgi:hypothetical protein
MVLIVAAFRLAAAQWAARMEHKRMGVADATLADKSVVCVL